MLTGHTGEVICTAVSRDGTLIASGSYNGEIKLWDVFWGQERATLQATGAPVMDLAFSPMSDVLVAGDVSGNVTTWRVATGRKLSGLRHPGGGSPVLSIAISPDGKTLVAGDQAGRLQVWDIADGEFAEPFDKQPGAIAGVAYSTDGTTLASTIDHSEVRIWDLTNGELLLGLSGQAKPLGKPAFSPDGQVLACGCDGGKVKLWDLVTGDPLATLEGHAGKRPSVVFSPDGATLFSGDWGGMIKMWDTKTLRQRANLKGHHGIINSVAVTPDGTTFVSAATDKTVRIWRAAREEDPQELNDLLQLETSVRLVVDADPEEQQRTLDDLAAHLESKIEKGLAAYDHALVDAAIWGLGNGGHQQLAAEAHSRFTKIFARGENPELRELARTLEERRIGHQSLLDIERARHLVQAGNFPKASETLSRTVGLHRKDLRVLAERGLLYARMRDWKKAAADYARATELSPDDFVPWQWTATLLVRANDVEKYRDHCRKMLYLFGDGDAGASGNAILSCLLLPGTVESAVLPMEAYERAVNEGSAPAGWGPCNLGLAAFRAGEPENAIRWLQMSQESRRYSARPDMQARVLLLLAMAHHQLSRRAEAVEALAQANNLIDEYLPKLANGELGFRWNNWVIADIFRREAKELIGL